MRSQCVLDIECYRNYFCAQTKDMATGEVHWFPMYEGRALDIPALKALLSRYTIYTFNGIGYDLPMLTLALAGKDNSTLKDAGDDIIVNKTPWWELYRKHGVEPPNYIDHVDVMEVAPGVRIGLKMYGARMHAKQLQDLPIEPSALISPVDRVALSIYCDNDLDTTQQLVDEVGERLALREALSEQYKVDLRSKSDAQIAEAVIKAMLPFDPQRRYIPHGYSFKYEAPAYIRFATPDLQQLLRDIHAAEFVVSDKEEALELFGDATGVRTGVQIPPSLKGRDIRIGNSVYRMGIGGLHSQEASVSHYGPLLRDVDVASYYPALILGMDMYPTQLGPAFLDIYRDVRDRRLVAKAAGNKVEADGLKIVLNGTFGKLFSKYSIFYAPEFGIRTTITGQLALLMLIELMEASGIAVVSANTDGIVLKMPPHLNALADSNIAWWEKATGLQMESTYYRSLHMRDVNSYIAVGTDGKIKRKGAYAKAGVLENKHPDKTICAEAVTQYLATGKSIGATIWECKDIRQFLSVRAVTGGAVHVKSDGTTPYLGKTVRWYHARGNSEHLAYKSNGNRVAGSSGVKPIMRLPDEFPEDIDYAHYVRVTLEMLADVGIPVRYWYHPESECAFITLPGELGNEYMGDEIDAKTYEKRKRQ